MIYHVLFTPGSRELIGFVNGEISWPILSHLISLLSENPYLLHGANILAHGSR
ncbi:MAG: hypothetical protein ACE5F6_14280 [Anaerolineae bacterium]